MFYQGIYTEIAGNTLLEYATAAGIFVALMLAFSLIQYFIIRSLKKVVKDTETNLDNALVSMVDTINPPFYAFIAFYLSTLYLDLEGYLAQGIEILLIAWLAYQVILAAQVFVNYFINNKLVDQEDRSSEVVGNVMRGGSKILLWGLGIIFVMSNVGIDVTSLLAGLGVGGIAIALAAQSVLGDLFSSLAIYFDKPFVPGELVSVNGTVGTVQKVGIKTTRIKSIGGEEVVIPNNEITATTINNLQRMERRRIEFSFGLVYGTSSDKMDRAREIVQEVVEGVEEVSFGRVHFKEFDDSSLNFEVVYHVESREYALYMDVNQEIMLGIKRKFEEEGIEMAFPTRTIHVDKAV